MKIKSIYVENFASYKELNFEFNQNGLVLIQGPTGAGKSTLCDVVPWVLFGRTAKNGSVDEVRRWNTEETTYGHIILDLNGITHTVTRKRGKNANDLCYSNDNANPDNTGVVIIRGKDLADTQKLINAALGMDIELYLSGAYLHEFSQTAQFFTANAKNRRTFCEQIVDLSMPKKIQDNMTAKRKVLKEELTKQSQKCADLKNSIDWQRNNLIDYAARHKTFAKDNQREYQWITEQMDTVLSKIGVSNAVQIEQLSALSKELNAERCKTCGAPVKLQDLLDVKEEIQHLKNQDLASKHAQREYDILTHQRSLINKKPNPHQGMIDKADKDVEAKSMALIGAENARDLIQQHLTDTEVLSDILESYRMLTIHNTIQTLETQTNNYLSSGFDAEIRVLFSASSADKLEIQLYKDGNLCTFTQLSKGQRCMLKLCFGISIMQTVANRHALSFSQVFFDECLDGLDSDMKLKSLKLLQNLQYSAIYLVEHHAPEEIELGAKYEVNLIEGASQLEETD